MTSSIKHLGPPTETQTPPKASPVAAFVVALGLVLAVAFAILVAGSEASASGTGTVTAGNEVFTFEASTCTISDGDFVVAGPGETDDVPFWVSASGRDITVTVGVESELEEPDLSRLWLSTDGPVNWQFTNSGVEATSVLFDVRQPDRAIPATLSASCEAQAS